MAEPSDSAGPSLSADQIVALCRQNLPQMAESLRLCFELFCELEAGEPVAFDAAASAPELLGAGLCLGFQVGSTGVLFALPENLPLPGWYSQPDRNQQARLETLPLEWSLAVLPEDLSAEKFRATPETQLLAALAATGTTQATALPLRVTGFGAAPVIWLIAPVVQADAPTPAAPPVGETPPPATSTPVAPWVAPRADLESRQRIRTLMKIPVPVIVKLAEKRITLSQLLAITPGSLVTFEKSCEDLLDLCINNQVYCRGEAVKLGEKFGLKINELTPPGPPPRAGRG